jgi:rhamnulokinase
MFSGDTFLAIDLGASSGRAIVGALDGERMQMHEVRRFQTPLIEEGGHLYWAIETLWEEVLQSLDKALQLAPALRSVSIDSWAVDYVPMDSSGVAVRRPYSYRDARTTGRLDRVLQRIAADELYAITGTQFLPFNTLSQIVADIEDESGLVARTATRAFIADYLLFRLSGVTAVDRTMASTSQLYDLRAGTWSDQLVRLVGDSVTRWPRIVDPGTILGRVRPDWLPMGAVAPAVIASCSHDTAAAVAAVPAVGDESWAYICSGTWSLVGAELSAPILTSAARRAGFTNEVGLDNTIRFLKNRTGTWILEECAREWRGNASSADWNTLMAEAAAEESPGFVIPCNQPDFAERGGMDGKIARACNALGRSSPSTRGGVVRLVLESVAESYRETIAVLESLTGKPIEVIHVVGGGARSELLNQLTADVCSRRVVAGPSEATALGNLLIQARTFGCIPDRLSLRDVARRSTEAVEYQPRSTPALVHVEHHVLS